MLCVWHCKLAVALVNMGALCYVDVLLIANHYARSITLDLDEQVVDNAVQNLLPFIGRTQIFSHKILPP